MRPEDPSCADRSEEWGRNPSSPPPVYRIVAQGRLDGYWWGRLGGMQVATQETPEGTVTILVGPVKDQSELSGVLNTLRDLHLPLLRVEVVEA